MHRNVGSICKMSISEAQLVGSEFSNQVFQKCSEIPRTSVKTSLSKAWLRWLTELVFPIWHSMIPCILKCQERLPNLQIEPIFLQMREMWKGYMRKGVRVLVKGCTRKECPMVHEDQEENDGLKEVT